MTAIALTPLYRTRNQIRENPQERRYEQHVGFAKAIRKLKRFEINDLPAVKLLL